MIVGIAVADDITETPPQQNIHETLEKLGITPRPEVCQGCEAEQTAYANAAADLTAAYNNYMAAEAALQDCEGQYQRPELYTLDTFGQSILVRD